MSLTPLDIHNKKFTRSFRGYDEDEINEFLDQVIKDYELTIRENKDLSSKVEELEEQISHFKSIEKTLNKSIVVAQDTAEELLGNARKESRLIVKEAEKNADRIINEALSESRQIFMEAEDLKKQGKVFRTRLRMLIEAQLDMIGSDDWEKLLDTEIDTNLDIEADDKLAEELELAD